MWEQQRRPSEGEEKWFEGFGLGAGNEQGRPVSGRSPLGFVVSEWRMGLFWFSDGELLRIFEEGCHGVTGAEEVQSTAEPESEVKLSGHFLLIVGEQDGVSATGDGSVAGGIGFECESGFVGGECPGVESEGGLDLGLSVDKLSLIAECDRAEAFEAGHISAFEDAFELTLSFGEFGGEPHAFGIDALEGFGGRSNGVFVGS